MHSEKQKLKVAEYARQMQCNTSTVYRQIQQGKLEIETPDGVTHVVVDAVKMHNNSSAESELLQQKNAQLRSENDKLCSEIEYLRQELSQAQQRHDESQQQSNMITMQLTKQLEHHQLMIEDMRNRSVWRKVKIALGFASS